MGHAKSEAERGMRMDEIAIREEHEFTKAQLQNLFLSVEWSSGHYPDRLVVAMRNFETVYAAWDGEKLAGLICAMDDGSMTAYVHYLLVRPECQGKGIGKALVERIKERYADYLRIVVVAYDDEMGFYERCGFEKAGHSSPMFITSLWT
jgi:GNAT superfamily N-acetyltransferase